MTTRAFTMSSNVENKAVSAKECVLPRRFEPTKRPALYSISNRTCEPSISNLEAKVLAGPSTRSYTSKVSVKPDFIKPLVKPVRTVVNVPKQTVKSVQGNKPAQAVVKPNNLVQPSEITDVPDSTNALSNLPKLESPAPMDISKVEELCESFSQQLLDVTDVDAGDERNPQLASIYVNDIYDYMRQLELNYAVRPNYLDGQKVTARMRGILIDWLSQVNRRFELLPETFYLTVNILDRYMQQSPVAKNKLQLVAVTSMFIAAKYEEIYTPPIDELSYITDRAYTTAEIRRMEVLILKELDFSFNSPLPLHFLRRASKAGRVDITVHTLAKYLTEQSVIEYDLVHYRPSQIAAAALYLSLTLLRKSVKWSSTLVHYSKYSEKELKPVACRLAAMVIKLEKSKLQAIRNKYASRQLLEISTIDELKGEKIKALAALATI